MKNDATASRPKLRPFQDLRPGGGVKGILDSENSDWTPGIGFSRGRTWKEQRIFALRVLKDFGFGKSSMEDTLLDEVDKLCEEISKLLRVGSQSNRRAHSRLRVPAPWSASSARTTSFHARSFTKATAFHNGTSCTCIATTVTCRRSADWSQLGVQSVGR